MARTVTTQKMRRLEVLAEKRYGIPTLLLMENAGRSVADWIHESLKHRKKRILVLSGQGNNGGDGFCAARHLTNRGHHVTTIFLGVERRLKADALVNFRILKKMRMKHYPRSHWSSRLARRELRKADLVVDALLGTGLTRDLREPYLSAVGAMNASDKKIVSVDVPSGLDSDTGKVHGDAVRAYVTVTLGYPKLGITKPPARKYAGRIVVGDISLPKSLWM